MLKRFFRLLPSAVQNALRRQYYHLTVNHAHAIEQNRDVWTAYDWSQYGEEWSNTPEWRISFIEEVLKPHHPQGTRHILEIGPGGGRWTETLLDRAEHVTVVDLTPRCIEICKERFKDRTNISYFINDGCDLSFIETGSIDRIWSFDVFVHINPDDVNAYVQQFPRILMSGGEGCIHHAMSGANEIGWRSGMTAELMQQFCQSAGLQVLSQSNTWHNGQMSIWRDDPKTRNLDTITHFKKP